MATTLGTNPAISFLGHAEQLKQLLVRDLHLMSRDEQLSAVHVLVDAVVLLKRNVNSLIPVHRLPPELLTLVFEFAILRDDRITMWNDRWSPKDAVKLDCVDIVLITHVCHAWRSVALATPRLWTYLDNKYHSAKLAAFLSRSQAVPVSLRFTKARSNDLVKFVKQFGRRLGRLDVVDMDGPFKLRSLQFIGSHLECVTMSAEIDEPRLPRGQAGPRTKLTAFEQAISLLKGLAVYVEGSGHWMPITHFPNLTHLYLMQHSDRSRELLLGSLTTLAVNAPRLQVLHLCGLPATPRGPSTAPHTTLQPVALPHLRLFICSRSDLGTSLRLLSLLQIPESLHVYVSRHSFPAEIPQIHPTHWRAWTNGLTRLEVAIVDRAVRVVIEGDRSGPGLWMEFTGWHNAMPDELRSWFHQLSAVLPLDSIRSLDFFVGSWWEYESDDLLRAVLAQLPSLATLRFPGHSARPTNDDSEFRLRNVPGYTPYTGMLHALMPSKDPFVNNLGSVRCPALTTLYLEARPSDLELRPAPELRPDDDGRLDDSESPWQEPEELPLGIVNALTDRAQAGVPLQTVTLRVLQDASKLGPNEDAEALLQPIRAMLSVAESHVDELRVELAPDVPSEPAASYAQWDFSEELEKYWIVPELSRPSFLKDSMYHHIRAARKTAPLPNHARTQYY